MCLPKQISGWGTRPSAESASVPLLVSGGCLNFYLQDYWRFLFDIKGSKKAKRYPKAFTWRWALNIVRTSELRSLVHICLGSMSVWIIYPEHIWLMLGEPRLCTSRGHNTTVLQNINEKRVWALDRDRASEVKPYRWSFFGIKKYAGPLCERGNLEKCQYLI